MNQRKNNTWHVQLLENDFYLGTPGSFDHDFTPLPNNVGGVFFQKTFVWYFVWDYNYNVFIKITFIHLCF